MAVRLLSSIDRVYCVHVEATCSPSLACIPRTVHARIGIRTKKCIVNPRLAFHSGPIILPLSTGAFDVRLTGFRVLST